MRGEFRFRLAGMVAARITLLLMLFGAALPAAAQVAKPPVQSVVEALAQDGGEYARRYGVSLDEAMRRLRAQEESVPETDRIRSSYADRIVGIAFEHEPQFRILVRLAGNEPVEDRTILAGGMAVPVVFHIGAPAAEARILEVLSNHRNRVLAILPRAQGMGLDQRTGELVVMLRDADATRVDLPELRARIEEAVDVPVRLGQARDEDGDLAFGGGGRLVGIEPANGRRYLCTTGFVVTDGTRTGIATAAHCLDDLTYHDPEEGQILLQFVGGWGARYQDVQVHVADRPLEPLFYSDTAKKSLRSLATWRNRTSTRGGEFVCRRGETTGYSCAEVELTHYSPPGSLCGGPCDPTWITVAGPSCKGGDSGGPVFLGNTAYGIIKGANYAPDGSCNFYYYMSTDFVPEGWSLLYRSAPIAASGRTP